MTSAWTHFLSGQSGNVDICPALLNGLTMGPTHTFRIVERVVYLT